MPSSDPLPRVSRRDCCYDNGKALSKTQILQQRITLLEARLTSLQARGANSSGPSSVSGASPVPSGAGNDGIVKKDVGGDISAEDASGASELVGIHTSSRSLSMGAFPSSLHSDSAFGTSLDYINPTIAPQLITSPYLQSTVDLYDPNAAWPNSAGLSDQQQDTLHSSPSAFTLNDSADPSLSSSGTLSKSNSSLDFRGSLRAIPDPNCITATEEGRRYLYVFAMLSCLFSFDFGPNLDSY